MREEFEKCWELYQEHISDGGKSQPAATTAPAIAPAAATDPPTPATEPTQIGNKRRPRAAAQEDGPKKQSLQSLTLSTYQWPPK